MSFLQDVDDTALFGFSTLPLHLPLVMLCSDRIYSYS